MRTRKVGLPRLRPMIGVMLIGFASRSVRSVVLPSALPQPSVWYGEASPSPVYGARLLSGLRAQPSRGFKSRRLRHLPGVSSLVVKRVGKSQSGVSTRLGSDGRVQPSASLRTVSSDLDA